MLSQSCKPRCPQREAPVDVLKVNDLDDDCFGTPAIADRSIYVRTKRWNVSLRGKVDRNP